MALFTLSGDTKIAQSNQGNTMKTFQTTNLIRHLSHLYLVEHGHFKGANKASHKPAALVLAKEKEKL